MANVRILWMAVAVALTVTTSGLGTARVHAADAPEPPVGGPGADGDYLRVIHQRLHPGWVDGYLRLSPYKVLGPASSQRQAEVSIVIRWDGTVDKAEIIKSSGADDFDAAALNTVLLAAPFPPPVDVMADDGLVHLKWLFARNHRRCSGGEVVHVEYPLPIALPNLISRGQMTEAVRRMREQVARVGWNEDFLSPFIRQWLSRPNLSTELDARATAALAAAGDRQQMKALESLLLAPATAGIAASALDLLGVDVGVLLEKALATGGAVDNAAALAAIRAVPAAARSCSACAQVLATAVSDPRKPARDRVEVIGIAAKLERSEALTRAFAVAAKDGNAAVRGAALLAQLPPGRGRPGVIRMAALLRDPAPEIRAAGSAGVLRAGGNSGLEQLYLLSRDRDSRPLVAAAAELGRMSSEESADLLRRLLKRPEKNVRVAVVTALATRSDAVARALVEPILQQARQDATEEAPIRQLALQGASPAELVSMSSDTRLGLSVYRALLDRQQRPEAAQWLLANVEHLPADERIMALGAWIAQPAKAAPKVATTAQQQ